MLSGFFVPVSVPLARRHQTAACVFLISLALGSIGFNFVVWFLPFGSLFMLMYIPWIYFDRNTAFNGGRISQLLRKYPRWIWKPFVNYFPASLRAMTTLDPSRPYIFGIHPHGIMNLSSWALLLNDHGGVREVLPGIDFRIVTLGGNFFVPFWRELLLSLGLVASDRASIECCLAKGISTFIVVGGAQEALNARPGLHRLVLERRKGFVKIALQNGTPLVPVYCFGENELFNQIPNEPGSKVRRVQEWLKRKMGMSLPWFVGRGMWNYRVGLMPHRRPLTTVIGRPIEVPKIERPTDAHIDKYHKCYIEGLKALFEAHRDLVAPNELLELAE